MNWEHLPACMCVCMHTCVHMLPQQISKCITRKRKGFWNGKNSWRLPQGKCISLGLVPTDLRDLPIFFFGLFLAGLEGGLISRGSAGSWGAASSPYMNLVMISRQRSIPHAKFPGKHTAHTDWQPGQSNAFNLSWPSVLRCCLQGLFIPGLFVPAFSPSLDTQCHFFLSIPNPRPR